MKTVLIVEDNLVVSLVMEAAFNDSGIDSILMEVTGKAAIKAVKAERPDLVMMDISLAGEMDGIEAAIKIRAISDCSIIFVSANIDLLGKDERCNLISPIAILSKPLNIRELHRILESIKVNT